MFDWLKIPKALAQPLDGQGSANVTLPTVKVGEKAGFNVSGSVDNLQIGSYLAVAIKGFLSLMGIIFIILIIYAGFTWMTAGGDEQKVSKSKNTIARAAIGLFIVLSAYLITALVFNMIDNGPGSYPSSP